MGVSHCPQGTYTVHSTHTDVMPLCLICLTGGVFKLYLQFSEHYNGQPPEIFFHTIPFHPNGEFVFVSDVKKTKQCFMTENNYFNPIS